MNYDTWKATDPADRYEEPEDDDEPPEEYLVDEWWDDPRWQLVPLGE